MNQTAAMAAVRTAMRLRGVVVYHVGLRGGQVEVSFLTPQVGRRLEGELRVLSDRIGWPVAVSGHIERAQVTGQVRKIIGRGKIAVEISGDWIRARVTGGVAPEEQAAWNEAVRRAVGLELRVEQAG